MRNTSSKSDFDQRLFKEMSLRRSNFSKWMFRFVVLIYIATICLLLLWISRYWVDELKFVLSWKMTSKSYLISLGVLFAFATIASFVSLYNMVHIWRSGKKGGMRALFSFLLLAPFLFFVLSALIKSTVNDPINDVWTGQGDPPIYKSIIEIRNRDYYNPRLESGMKAENIPILSPVYCNEIDHLNSKSCEKLPEALHLSQDPDYVYELITNQIFENGWSLDYSETTGDNQVYIVGSAMTLPFFLVDDFVIILTDLKGEVRVDMRSASRVGMSDLGKNLERINMFFNQILEKAVSSALQ